MDKPIDTPAGLDAPRSKILNLDFSQKALAYFPDHAVYCSFYVNDHSLDMHQRWQELARRLDAYCADKGYRSAVILGVGFELWAGWSEVLGYSLPQGMGSKAKLDELGQIVGNSGGDLWFHIKSDDKSDAEALRALVEDAMAPYCLKAPLIVAADKRHGGKVLGGRFTDGIINPPDAEDLSQRTVIGGEDPSHRGGAFLISQRFLHDWEKLGAMSELDKQNMIGRDDKDRLIPMDDSASHIKRVRQLNGDRVNFRLLRQALPFGHKADNRSREEGVFFAGYAKASHVFDQLLDGIAGHQKGFIQDRLFSVTHSHQGSYWYVPSLEECGIQAGPGNEEITMNAYFDVRSENGYMFYNAKDYQHKVRHSKLTQDCPLSDRILALVDKQFSRWHDTWYKPRQTPPLGHLRDHLGPDDKALLDASVVLRKGKATQLSLSKILVSPEYSKKANLLAIDPLEIIVGNMPQLSLGIGSQVLEYLSEDEKITGFFSMLNEYSATGHNVPNHSRLLELGLDGVRALFSERASTAPAERRDFYQAVTWTLEGLSAFIEAYGNLARRMLEEGTELSDSERANLQDIAQRMDKIAHQAPETFLEGLNLVFLLNCALHQTGEPMSIGRLDQFMLPLYEQDRAAGVSQEAIQEMLDAFWLKMDETVLYNYNHLNDYLNYGTGAVFYSGGNFPQGAAINQWVQQLTVGGVVADDAPVPKDGSNDLTLMCLRSARRLPLNAPCLSLRVHKNMPEPLFEEAAKAILSGGAHPIMLNDDKLVPALMACGPLRLEDARDYTCDGCYEPVIAGKTEWAFSYVPLLPYVGMAINQGATIQGAGPVNLRGLKSSWNSPPAQEIHSFDKLMDIFYSHWKWGINQFFNTLMNGYGALWNYCPSPLFSAFLDDSLETGRDLTDGGARYHIVAPMMCGITNAINALYAIKKLVFDPATARCSLPQLLLALQCNWGQNMQPPFYTSLEGPLRRDQDAIFFKELRQVALALPKFGVGDDAELGELAKSVVARCVGIIHECFDKPLPGIKAAYEAIQQRYGSPERPFAFTITPGVGTFEDNVGLGMGMGASADGRLAGQPTADDFAAAPWPDDLPFNSQQSDPFTSLKAWNVEPINHGMANCAPIDLNIPEDFPLDKLTELVRDFAHGKLGSNMITITCADPATFQAAQQYPEKYDLVRVRMGGWSEFYVAMFDFHQDYILRRPYYAVPRG
ncbi:Dyp-type peroxidase [Gallaecimonas kandeliae]|uniref:Dyp-type peroxidase n=1 Tax=Gallaecimonas kandeliae TaxID=3029055 RepID=UPI002649C6DC|nr:Dyp-type peroxidase [Gallaecimonas kandeliae]WKE66999.1 Dyp-type peroxidase [Gallaecimonas kandeliae]